MEVSPSFRPATLAGLPVFPEGDFGDGLCSNLHCMCILFYMYFVEEHDVWES